MDTIEKKYVIKHLTDMPLQNDTWIKSWNHSIHTNINNNNNKIP